MGFPDNPDLAAAYQLTTFNVAFAQVMRHIYYAADDGSWQGRAESDAEHSYKLADLALALAPRLNPDLDLNKVLTYSLHHDKIEKVTGDASIWALEHASKPDREAAAMPELEKQLNLLPEIAELVHQYEHKADPESRFVYALDKIEAMLTIISNHGVTWKESGITYEKHKAKRAELRQKVSIAPELLPLFDGIDEFLAAHPEYFATEEQF